MDAVERGGVGCLKFGIAVEERLFSATEVSGLGRGVQFGEERLLEVGTWVTLDPVGSGTGTIVTERDPWPVLPPAAGVPLPCPGR